MSHILFSDHCDFVNKIIIEKLIMNETLTLLLMNELIQQDSIHSASSILVLLYFQKKKKGGEGVVHIFPIKREELVKWVGGGSSYFSHKKGGVGKMGAGGGGGGGVKKGLLTFFHTNSFQCYLSLSVWCVCFVYLHHSYQYYMCFT